MNRAERPFWAVLGILALSSCQQVVQREHTKATSAGPAQVYHAGLHDELLQMARDDQGVRKVAPAAHGQTDTMQLERLRTTDAANTTRIKEIVHQWGWPGHTLVGADGAHSAWLIVQHSGDFEFQKKCCALMEDAVHRKEASPVDLAYLTDRVRVHAGQPQIYGTQLRRVEGTLQPYPIEDEAGVDRRREALGMSSLSDYIKRSHL